MSVTHLLFDIEGTTSSISFVHEVLFPYAAEKIPAFLLANPELEELAAVDGDTLEEKTATLLEQIKNDVKDTALKSIQGKVWKIGFEDGSLKGHVYDEVPAKLREWKESGLQLGIYSSGSVAAQKLLFGHSLAGDLTSILSYYFDTHVGHKRQAESYKKIAAELSVSANSVLFLSDVAEELDAARSAGMKTVHLLRTPDVEPSDHKGMSDFSTLDPKSF